MFAFAGAGTRRQADTAAARLAFAGMTIDSLNDGASKNGVLVAARKPFR